tara:strand:+ start:1200 stop:1595 length:396 start_codon:yes stop_codon:yes gene_type:complete
MNWEDVLKVRYAKIKNYDEREEGRDNCCEKAKEMYSTYEPQFLNKDGLQPLEQVEGMECEEFHNYLLDLLQESNRDKVWYDIVLSIRNYKKRCDQNRQFFTPEGGRPMRSDDFGRRDPYEEGQRRFRRKYR